MAALRHAARRSSYGLTRKFSLFLAGLLTALTATLTAVSTLAEQQVTEERLRQRVEDSVALLADLAAGHLAGSHRDELSDLLVKVVGRDVLYVHVLGHRGELIAAGDPDGELSSWWIEDPFATGGGQLDAPRRLRDGHGLHAAEPIVLADGSPGSLRLALSTARMERDLVALSQRNILAGLAFLAGSLLLGLPLVRRITRPLAQLTESTEAASRGRFDRRIAIATNDELELLAASFNRMLGQLNDSIAQVRRLAYFDSVTDLPNRIQFRRLLGRTLAEARRHGRRAAVLYLDLDRFKLINDSFGHAAGDLLLQAFARRLTASLRGTDVVARADGERPTAAVARLGGDEFTILLSDIREHADPARIAERVLATLDHPFDLSGQAVVIGTSIGIALFPDDGADPETLLKNADVAMYSAKASGRNALRFYSSELGARSLERLTMERELRVALERDELELHYQPQVDLTDGAVLGFEALLRWQHPRLGIVAAQPIVALAQETRLIAALGQWVLRRACTDARSWPISGPRPLRVAINLSAQEVLAEDFVARLTEVLDATGLAPECVELEITETAVATEAESMGVRLAALKAQGVELAIDDFGTGHSSLCSLRRFRPDRLKIDRSFIEDLERDAGAAALVSAMIALAHSLELEVAATAVENDWQASFLHRQGCHRVQGFLYSPPLAADAVARWLSRRQRAGRGLSSESADDPLA